ncbi:hypothetical protein Desde_1069 [Desulfitobacterium dehalogenans ATCC 51507]|uniref:Uncharacterized protein n=1 Tax=Desulfitobacterium dehalogenans (strain ATCC 51507 / DSM 9161 / JW/IU-DC1) TaxID=756499 RepID=I4A6B7_DESDJ|nr:hypothetical protein [Desulfitobacterium dehalogenans]AFL99501.1 hypothetical protein Desde_1069 [Desulfitobacterium dehalogenans ATCC 51507]
MTTSIEKNTLQFHKLNGLTPTVESCTMKLIEELGELLQLIGKGQGSSGEKMNLQPELEAWETLESRMIDEAFDVAQSAVTMIFTLCEKIGYNPLLWEQAHENKLRDKGYLAAGKMEKTDFPAEGFLVGMANKFIVLKCDDVKEYLTKNDQMVLDCITARLALGRIHDKRKVDNNYLVINTDEPYAPEVVAIMKRHGHWG